MLGSAVDWNGSGRAVFAALAAFAVNPLLYAGVGLLMWDTRGCARDERLFFGVRSTRPGRRALVTVALSLVAGLWLTGCLAVAGIVVERWEVGVVSGLTLVLGMLRLRWFAPVHAIAMLVAVSFAARAWHPVQGPAELRFLWSILATFHAAGWLAVAAAVCLTEALLLTLQGWLRPRAVFVRSRRGRPLGAFAMQLAVVAPVAVWIPGGWWPFGQGVHPFGWPWFGGAHGLSWAGMPLLLGWSGVFTSVPVRTAALWTALADLAAALAAAAGAGAVLFGRPLAGVVAAGAVLAVRAVARLLIQRLEAQHEPRFAPTDKGVRVLATLPGSWAETLGLRPGEVITHVNQTPVHTAYDVHFALSQHPAYAKLQVLDHRGELRLAGRAVYDGERVKLGLLLAPADATAPAYDPVPYGLLETCRLRLHVAKPGWSSPAETSALPADPGG
ncbi:MAG: PDZ domain-containing protein [Alicyclobacillus sp.]|nr:PDZ domain-containing protein [Alicyclobacillus sp.]